MIYVLLDEYYSNLYKVNYLLIIDHYPGNIQIANKSQGYY